MHVATHRITRELRGIANKTFEDTNFKWCCIAEYGQNLHISNECPAGAKGTSVRWNEGGPAGAESKSEWRNEGSVECAFEYFVKVFEKKKEEWEKKNINIEKENRKIKAANKKIKALKNKIELVAKFDVEFDARDAAEALLRLRAGSRMEGAGKLDQRSDYVDAIITAIQAEEKKTAAEKKKEAEEKKKAFEKELKSFKLNISIDNSEDEDFSDINPADLPVEGTGHTKAAEQKTWQDNPIRMLTWNAGGGQPTPEFLGGEWEKKFGEFEKMTGVLMHIYAGCDKLNKKYTKRYGDMFEETKKFREGEIKSEYGSTQLKDLLDGLDTHWGESLKAEWKECTVGKVLRVNLGLCANGEEMCQGFDLKTEGCWKKRYGLPVYGPEFMQLVKYRGDVKSSGEEDKKKIFWGYYLEGLKNQTEWEEKGCGIKGAADKNEEKSLKKKVKPYHAILKTSTWTSEMKEKIPEISYEKWSETAAWDVLIVDLTRKARELLPKMTAMPDPVKFTTDTDVEKTIQDLFANALKKKQVDVAFVQEGKMIKNVPGGYTRVGPNGDTAIFVKHEIGIDEDSTVAVQDMWGAMTSYIKKRWTEETKAIEAAINKLTKENAATLPEENAATLLEDEVIKKAVVEKKLKDTLFYAIGKSQLERLTTAQAEKLKSQTWEGIKYVPPKLATLAVTRLQPKRLLLSIHSDSDGYYAVQFLHLAVKVFEKVRNRLELKYMHIGMDANLQPSEGENPLSFDKSKGFQMDQFAKLLPPGMVMAQPDMRTVFKVRSFLQTQFSKVGKEDSIVKDLLFTYTADKKYTHKEVNVYNKYAADEFSIEKDDAIYYPTESWPVDHFMVFATAPPGGGEPKEPTSVQQGQINFRHFQIQEEELKKMLGEEAVNEFVE